MDVDGDQLPELFVFDYATLLPFCGVSGSGALEGYLWGIRFQNETLVTMWGSADTFYTFSAPAIAKLPIPVNNSTNSTNTKDELFIICALHDMNTVYCLNARNGSTLFTQTLPFVFVCPASPPSYSYGDMSSLAIVSLYPNDAANGVAYLLAFSAIYKLDYNSLPLAPTFHCSLPHTFNYQVPHAADIDLDGVSEVFYEHCVYNADCSVRWCAPTTPTGSGAASAIANIDSDPESEVIIASDNTVYVLEHDSSSKWSFTPTTVFPGTGPPTINDFNNDGYPDVGFATYERYYILSGPTGGVLQSFTPTLEDSYVTGSITFDFDNDGRAEFIYCDVIRCHIYGTTSTVSIPVIGATGNEHSIVIDLDFDGTADIVTRSTDGVYVINSYDSWYGTVKQWNAHAYVYGNSDSQGHPQFTLPTKTFRANPTV